jgi:hypothetical protein
VYEAQYEALRSQVTGTAGAAPRGVGLALLQQQGLAAWIAAVQCCALPSRLPAPAASGRPMAEADGDRAVARAGTLPVDVLPQAQYLELTRLLASLVLSARPGCRSDRHDHGGSARC